MNNPLSSPQFLLVIICQLRIGSAAQSKFHHIFGIETFCNIFYFTKLPTSQICMFIYSFIFRWIWNCMCVRSEMLPLFLCFYFLLKKVANSTIAPSPLVDRKRKVNTPATSQSNISKRPRNEATPSKTPNRVKIRRMQNTPSTTKVSCSKSLSKWGILF